MTVTLDGKTLNVSEDLEDGYDVVDIQWDRWESGAYRRKVKVYGAVQTWRIPCYEKDVAWASSQVKSFRETAAAGTAVNLTVTHGGDTIVNKSVYIVAVPMRIKVGPADSSKYREFTLTLQEAQ